MPLPALSAVYLPFAIAALALVVWIVRRLIRGIGRKIDRLDGFEGNNPRLTAALHRIDLFLVYMGALLGLFAAAYLLQAPPWALHWLVLAIRLFATFAAGVVLIRSAGLLVDIVETVAHNQAIRRGWIAHDEGMTAVVPTLRSCLTWALRIGLATALALQLPYASDYATIGPRLLAACALVLAGRAALEFGVVEINRQMLLSEGLTETDRRRRATLAPLVRSGWTYATYFGTFTLVLHALGFDVMPFLAGAGIIGLVVGFGAQAMINDVVSGFFILFEHVYLVGDLVEAGGARGVVEAIEFRTTKIRDPEGRLHIIRNGDMKPVINYSRDYGMAVVAVDVSYEADLDRVFRSLREAGAMLHARNADVLADTEIEGITAFGASALTVRTATRVKPGRHESVAAALRLMLKQAFDREAGNAPRSGLIPIVHTPESARAGH
jgi:moderate conductance mechanosensitive channel